MGRRRTWFAATLITGIVLAVVGFFLSAPIGPTDGPVYSNPRMDFAPLVFVIGVVLGFMSAVVYELIGD
jgi:H+/Cl- antiporter ClcA